MVDRNKKWTETAPLISIALLHSLVKTRDGNAGHTSVTNLDVHDIARLGRTFGIGAFYVVTEVPSQQAHAARIVDHWISGHGAVYNPHRMEALKIVSIVDNLEAVRKQETDRTGTIPALVGTAARKISNKIIDYADVYDRMLCAGSPVVLVFGTGSGLHEEAVRECDAFLKPITGIGDYNHLSVRSAATITIDRIFSSM